MTRRNTPSGVSARSKSYYQLAGLRVRLTETGEEFTIPPVAVGEDLRHQDAFIPYETEQSAYNGTNSGEAFGEVGKRIHGKLLQV